MQAQESNRVRIVNGGNVRWGQHHLSRLVWRPDNTKMVQHIEDDWVSSWIKDAVSIDLKYHHGGNQRQGTQP